MKEIHITTSAGGVVLNSKGEVLVVNQNGNSWSLPKGHVEAGEDSLTAARREIHEESGISDLEFIKAFEPYERYRIGMDGKDDLSELKTLTFFLFKTNEHILKPIDPENPEARWVAKDKVADYLTHQKDKEFMRKIQSEI
jgi:8-oxo-dGTP pyrophosphatase MutT (NUDIX family)